MKQKSSLGLKSDNLAEARTAAMKLLRKGVGIVAMESGDGGDLILTQSEEHFFPRLKVKTVDATGAGDAFAGAFAVGLAQGLPSNKSASSPMQLPPFRRLNLARRKLCPLERK